MPAWAQLFENTPRGDWKSPYITASQSLRAIAPALDAGTLQSSLLFILKPQIKDTLSLLPRHLCSHPRCPPLWRQCGERSTSSRLRNERKMAGITDTPTDTPTEKHLDRQWTLIQACTVMYRFVGNSPQYHPILPNNPFISRFIQVRVVIFSSLRIMANLDMASLGGGALVKRYIWLATVFPGTRILRFR